MEINYNFTFPISSQNCFDFSYDSEKDVFNSWSNDDSFSLNNLTKSLNNDKSSTDSEDFSNDICNISEVDKKFGSEEPTGENLETQIKQEIDEKGINFALDLCLKTKNSEQKKSKKKLRNKQTKTKEQIERLEQELKENPHRWSKKERVRIATDIGLTQLQVYKWYYDNITSLVAPVESNKRQKTQE